MTTATSRRDELRSLAESLAFDPYALTPDQWASEARQAIALTDERDNDDPPHSSDCPRAVISSAECMCPAENASRYRDDD